jgi:predicted DNA-binding protein YlxM (UPF0122 family)
VFALHFTAQPFGRNNIDARAQRIANRMQTKRNRPHQNINKPKRKMNNANASLRLFQNGSVYTL